MWETMMRPVRRTMSNVDKLLAKSVILSTESTG